jgi:hypothetical protein
MSCKLKLQNYALFTATRLCHRISDGDDESERFEQVKVVENAGGGQVSVSAAAQRAEWSEGRGATAKQFGPIPFGSATISQSTRSWHQWVFCGDIEDLFQVLRFIYRLGYRLGRRGAGISYPAADASPEPQFGLCGQHL